MKKIICIVFFILLSCSSKKNGKQVIYNDDNVSFSETKIDVFVFKIKKKYGLEDKLGNVLVKPIYSNIKILDNKFILVNLNDKIGVFDKTGKQLIEPNFYSNIKLSQTFEGKIEPFFIITDIKNKKAIFNKTGKQIYPFEIDDFDSDFTYKNQVYFSISKHKKVPYKLNGKDYFLSTETKFIKIKNDTIQVLLEGKSQIKKFKNNLVSFYFIDNTVQTGLFDLNTDKNIVLTGDYYYNELTDEIWANTGTYFDKVIDSTLTVKPNKYKNVIKIENDNCFLETTKGMQIMNIEGKTYPYIYPKIESFNKDTNKYSSIYGKDYSDYQKKIFKFYKTKDSKRYGVIDINGNIIVDAEKFDYVIYSDLNNINSYNRNLPSYKQQYLRENKLDRLFYATNYYSDKSGQVKIFKENGSELINIPVEKGDYCYLELSQFSNHGHLMAKCNEKMKIFDLNSKKLVFEINESKSSINFTERYQSGYYYFSYNNPKQTKINYLSNKLKLLYEQEVVNDSVWYKIIKEDKVYFKNNNKIGLTDFDEKVIVPAEYDKIDILNNAFNIVKLDKKMGVITDNNKIVIEIIYDKIIYNISNQSFECYRDDKKEIKYLN